MNSNINLRWCSLLRATLTEINILHSLAPSEGVNEFVALLDKTLTNHGATYTIKLFKQYRLRLQQIGLGQPLTEIPFRKTDKDGLPCALRQWKITTDSTIERKRYVFTVWRTIDLLRVAPKYEVSTIISETQPDLNLIEDITNYLKTWSGMKVLPRKPARGYMVMSTKAGPNGPASISCIEDLLPLSKDKPLYNSVVKLLGISLPGLDPDRHLDLPSEGKRHSKLVLLSDKAGKTRVVAIGDWWSNTALSGLHKTFLKALEKMDTDVTFRQSDIPNLIKGFGDQLYSSDMTAFTDVFPRILEKNLINTAWPGMGDLWEQVISNRVFEHPEGGVKYATGNPMGLLSSWPVSSFTHHAVKAYCAHKCGRNKYKYLILGDDSLDTNKEVYKYYLDVMTRLGVSTSLSKCTQSENGSAEFAKRLFFNKIEVTGLPVDLLTELHARPEQFIELVRIARERGYEDKVFAPGVEVLASKNKSSKMIADILALPESATGMPPLLEVKPGSWAETMSQIPEESVKTLISIARDREFADLVSDLEKGTEDQRLVGKSRLHVDERHPILIAIGTKLMDYLGHGEDEFSIYKAWQEGNYREMAHVPNIDTYRIQNKGHFVTRCKYNVFASTLALASGDCNIRLARFPPVSNFDLFQLGYPKEVESGYSDDK